MPPSYILRHQLLNIMQSLHTRQQKICIKTYAISRSKRIVLFPKISSVRREVCVNTGRLTGGLFCTQITREKTEGEPTKSSKDNSIDGLGFCNYKYNLRTFCLITIIVLVSRLYFKVWWFISQTKTCLAHWEGLAWVNSLRTPGTPQKKLHDSIHSLAQRADIEI